MALLKPQKLAAIIARGTRKDYIDLYFILQQTPLERLFMVAAVKYAQVRTFAVSAVRALTYFVDAEATGMPQMIERTSWATIKRFLERQALEAGRQHLEGLWSSQKPHRPPGPDRRGVRGGLLPGWHGSRLCG